MSAAVRKPIPAEAFAHGDARRYRRGCSCQPCTTAATAEARRWRYLRNTGRSGTVSASKVINHVWKLRAAGMTDQEIRAAAALAPPHLYQIIRNGGAVKHSTATRILNIPVPTDREGPTRNGAHIPILGTRRRLQTLNAEGWPCKDLDRRLDTGRGYTAYLIRAASDLVRFSTADSVRHLYAGLEGLTPEEHGVTAVNAKVTRARAAAKEWARAVYWDADDFDDPGFTPATSDDLNKHELGALRRAEIEHLTAFKISHADIASRLDMSEGYVRDIAREIDTATRRIRPTEGAAANPSPQAVTAR